MTTQSHKRQTNWFASDPAAPGPRLFCLPHAGGSASTYVPWVDMLAPDIAVLPVQLPGRDSRQSEHAETDVGRLASRLAEALLACTDRPYALFGHSLGAVVAFETTRSLLERGSPVPQRLFVAGSHCPEEEAAVDEPLHALPDAEFLAQLTQQGGMPSSTGADELSRALLPRLRADWTAAETYIYRPGPPLPCPISVLCGQSDPMVDTARLDRWGRHTVASANVRLFPGDHFFLRDAETFIHRAIRKDLLADHG